MHKTTCVPTHCETASKFTVTPQTTVTNAAVAPVTQTARKLENIKASDKTVHAKNPMLSNVDAAPHIHKSNPPAAPTDTSVRFEYKSPRTDPSQAFTNKGNKSPPRLGECYPSLCKSIPFLSTHFDCCELCAFVVKA